MDFKALISIIVLLFSVNSINAEERILQFHSDIKVQVNSSLLISETIIVNSEGNKIKRGIFRDLLTHYRNKQNTLINVKYKIVSVTRDGHAENWSLKNIDNAISKLNSLSH